MSLFDLKKNQANITAFYALSLTNFDMSLHQHESCEIMYVKKGHCFIYTQSEKRTLYEGDFVFLDAHVPHRLFVDNRSPCSLLNLEFSVGEQGEISLANLRKHSSFLQQKTQAFPTVFFAYDNNRLKQPLEKLIGTLSKNSLQNTQSEDTFLIDLLFQQCLLELGNLLHTNTTPTPSPYLEKALLYISEHLEEELRVPNIANYVGINKSYLHALFSEQLGTTIATYINQKRLEQACFLLANSELSITDVAFKIGYNSRQHFSQTFTQHYGLSPKAYKLQKQSIEYQKDNVGQFRKQSNENNWEVIKMKNERSI